MKKIAKPTISVKTVFLDCISIVSNANLKNELNKCITTLEDAELDFEKKMKKNEIHKIAQNNIVLGVIGKEEMKKVYTDRMAKIGKPGRAHYETIISSVKNGRCPLCSHRIVSTLDHYLPKSKYPVYSVTPINLIPSCFECNKGKKVEYPSNSKEETLHPYFDDVEGDSWLKAKIITSNPIGFEYYVSPSNKWNDLLNERIKTHFKSFELNTLYSIHAIVEFQNIRLQLINLFKSGGYNSLKGHLKDCYDSRSSNDLNSWQTAFYEALYNDEWFCNGGLEN